MKYLMMACLLFMAPVYAEVDKADKKESLEEAREEIRAMRDKALEDLLASRPELTAVIEDAEAVAAFSSLGFNLFVLSTARGGGVIRDTASGEETFMRMLSVGGGVGMGVKDFRVIFVFHTRDAYDKFLSQGWDFTGQGDLAVEGMEKGASIDLAVSMVNGVSMFQLTENGLALQATLQGTRYYYDKKLND